MRLLLFILLSAGTITTFGQIGGKRSFEFLNLPTSSRITALGGINVSLIEQDGLQLIANPALSDSITGGEMAISWLNYFADVNQSIVNYVVPWKDKWKFNVGAIYLDYGDFQGFDATGLPTGNFSAKEYAVIIGTSHKLNAFTVGTNLKFAHSLLDNYSASAMLLDIGGTFRPGKSGLTFGMMFKNIGVLLSDYSASSNSKLPFDVQVGTTFKPAYMPFRFSFTAYNLARENIVFFDENLDINESEPGFAEKIFRRVNVGAELLLSKNFQVQFGYNYLLRQELRLQQTAGGAGFSFGLLLRVKRFELNYARSKFHAAGGTNQITLASNLNYFKKKENL